MRVIFYWFNLGSTPGGSLGVSLLARELADAGHRVAVLHLNEEVGLPFDLDGLLHRPEVSSADLHALSFGSNHADLAQPLAAALGSHLPGAHVVCGGVHTTLNATDVLAWDGVDAVCIGEADGLLLRYVEGLALGHSHLEVPSFWIQGPDGVHQNAVAPPPSLHNQALPYFDGVDYDRLIRANRGFVEVLAHRGCPRRCSYCHNAAILDTLRAGAQGDLPADALCRQRPVLGLLDELEAYRRRYKDAVKVFNFADDTLVRDVDWLRELADTYPQRVGLPFVCNAHLNEIDDEVIALLARAGCRLVKLGVESGSARLRDEVLLRPLDEARLQRVVRQMQAAELNVRAYVMVGLPTETAADRRATIQLCARLRFDSVRPAILQPYPGTRLHAECAAQGLIVEGQPVRAYNTRATLKASAAERVEIERTLQLYAWLLNQELGGAAAEAAQSLLQRVGALAVDQWSVQTGAALIHELGTPVHDALSARDVDHFYAPFLNRPDVVFLYRDRAQPLVNVDDG